jgi:hypothetical protein
MVAGVAASARGGPGTASSGASRSAMLGAMKLRRRDLVAALILVLLLASLVVALVYGAIPR